MLEAGTFSARFLPRARPHPEFKNTFTFRTIPKALSNRKTGKQCLLLTTRSFGDFFDLAAIYSLTLDYREADGQRRNLSNVAV
jgi:hypothetical protein